MTLSVVRIPLLERLEISSVLVNPEHLHAMLNDYQHHAKTPHLRRPTLFGVVSFCVINPCRSLHIAVSNHPKKSELHKRLTTFMMYARTSAKVHTPVEVKGFMMCLIKLFRNNRNISQSSRKRQTNCRKDLGICASHHPNNVLITFFRPNENAEEIVSRHIKLLHRYNEAKDATQVQNKFSCVRYQADVTVSFARSSSEGYSISEKYPHILTLKLQLAAIRGTTIRQIHQDMSLLDDDAN